MDDIAASRKEKGGRGGMESLAPGISRRGTLYVGSSIAALRGKVQPVSEQFDPDVYLGLVHGVRFGLLPVPDPHPGPGAWGAQRLACMILCLLVMPDPSTWHAAPGHAVRQQQPNAGVCLGLLLCSRPAGCDAGTALAWCMGRAAPGLQGFMLCLHRDTQTLPQARSPQGRPSWEM